MTTSSAALKPPPCPITGAPAIRLIQEIPRGLLIQLWRHAGGVELGHLLRGKGPIRLWESPCGLAFFDPMIGGDGALYPAFYSNVGADEWLFGDSSPRGEFTALSALIGEGDRVLDIGCGRGALGGHIPQARYVGLDPYAPEDADERVLRQELQAHADANPGVYDAVCALQVLEHSAEPLAMARLAVRALRPGGLFIAAVPSWPSPLVEIPNMPANTVPHHLSWWTTGALEALCRELGLEAIAARSLPAQVPHRLLHWTAFFSPVKATGPYFRRSWPWHLSLAFGHVMARLVSPFAGLPPGARSMDVFVAARKPG
ncbi:MAG TPA: class I SAM-dependent methyltransferase [Caulobacteraceae bacterium]